MISFLCELKMFIGRKNPDIVDFKSEIVKVKYRAADNMGVTYRSC